MNRAVFFTAALFMALPACAEPGPSRIPLGTKQVALTYGDPRLTEFHKQVLVSMNLSYTVESTPSGVNVWWTPRSEEESFEVQYRVSQYAFAITNCPPSLWPTPETPAGTIKQCPGQ